jgi:GNAT superfamily N-acetyltransferase
MVHHTPMTSIDRARALWIELAKVPVEFPAAGQLTAVESADSWLCPAGWVGIVVLDGAAIATAPDAATAALLRPLTPDTSLDRLRSALPIVDALGPASLAYLDEPDFQPTEPHRRTEANRSSGAVRVVRAEPVDLAPLLAAEDAGESGLDEITSDPYVVRAGGRVVAAAGYRLWPTGVAHVGVATDPAYRGRGLAGVVASAATADALRNGLLPQWRARIEPSRRVAARLGYRELGSQVSVRLEIGSVAP